MLFRLALGFSVLCIVVLGFGSARFHGWLTWPDEWVRNVVFVLALCLALGAIRYRTDL